MNPILGALRSGYPPEKILQYLQTMMPQMLPAVEKATKAGYSLKTILGFLSRNFETEDRKGLSESQLHAVNRRADAERTKFGIQAVGVAAASPAAQSMMQSALSRAIPSQLAQGLGNAQEALPSGANQQALPNQGIPPQQQPQQPLGNLSNPSQQPPVNPQPSAATQPNIPQPTQPAQAQAIAINPTEILKKNNLTDKIDQLIASGNDVEGITGFFRKFHPDIVKKLEKEGQQDFENIVNSYVADKGKPEKSEVQMPKIEKNSTVATPNGVGEVLELRNGQAIVEIDGKKHKVAEDELISPPMPEKDLADLYDDLVSGIEKETGQQVSRNVDWAGYDPNTNELAYKPHGSDKLYVYEDISPEDVEMLTSLLTQRKSTGSNYIGAWSKDTASPIGAPMYQLIQKLQKERGGKGNEYRSRYDTIYDALEPAKIAAKKAHAERKKKAKKP